MQSELTSSSVAVDWMLRTQETLARYSEPLLRQVAGKLLKPRNQWPVEELLERSLNTLTNAVTVDRRLKELPESARKLLKIIAASHEPCWKIGHLISMLAVLGHVEGLTPIQQLLEMGFAYPDLPAAITQLSQLEDWLGGEGILQSRIFVPPIVSDRATSESLGWPAVPSYPFSDILVRETDGLDWLLRIGVAWQQVAISSMRLTQQDLLFKRDLVRLQTDDLFRSPFLDPLCEVPDVGILSIYLGRQIGLFEQVEGELKAGRFPGYWDENISQVLATIWKKQWGVEHWHPIEGYQPTEDLSPYPSISLLLFLALNHVPTEEWVRPRDLVGPLWGTHPAWASVLRNKVEQGIRWVETYLLGVAHPLRWVDVGQKEGEWYCRLSALGRAILEGEDLPHWTHEFPQTLVVQPNGELIVFRQGLTPALLHRLSRFANWKTLGAACTVELQAESVYRGLETGLNLRDIITLLEKHGTRAIPATVLDSLQRWSNKRERIAVYSSATLLEFNSSADLEVAFQRGLVVARLTDRIGLAENADLDYKHFRLLGNRDYEARPQKCLIFDPDGITFTVDPIHSDLLLEAELTRMAQPIPNPGNGHRRFVFTRQSLQAAQEQGLSLTDLEQWVRDRSGEELSASARLLFGGSIDFFGQISERIVIQLPSELVTDGVMQWPETARWIEERLGPCSITVHADNRSRVIEALGKVGIVVEQREHQK